MGDLTRMLRDAQIIFQIVWTVEDQHMGPCLPCKRTAKPTDEQHSRQEPNEIEVLETTGRPLRPTQTQAKEIEKKRTCATERVAHVKHDAQGGGLGTDCNRNSAFSFAVGRHFVRDHQKLGGARVYAFFYGFFCCLFFVPVPDGRSCDSLRLVEVRGSDCAVTCSRRSFSAGDPASGGDSWPLAVVSAESILNDECTVAGFLDHDEDATFWTLMDTNLVSDFSEHETLPSRTQIRSAWCNCQGFSFSDDTQQSDSSSAKVNSPTIANRIQHIVEVGDLRTHERERERMGRKDTFFPSERTGEGASASHNTENSRPRRRP